ncbi:MAG: prepilin signal peptidase PulO-like peptidase [Paenibacillus sp.]|jgi:leader peptidase (prepilin peptidase)/N-methyltransferase|nr:prepilin signal peptidase PulO-like peptidase [Paenibacillus sp.]
MNLTILYLPFVILLGLIIGSFLNVVAIRMLKNESIAYPPSHCVHCNHQLKPTDLIPVFSFLFLQGKCRYCKSPISKAYPLGEAVTAIVFGIVFWNVGYTLESIVGLLFASVVIVAVMTDLRSRIIPDKLILFGILSAIVLRLFIHPLPWWDYIAAFFVGSGILFLIAIVSKGGMGGGDIKLFAFLGLIVGIKLILLTLFISSLLGSLYGLLLLISSKLTKRHAVPFGPFIAAGSMIAYLWGNPIINWYLSFIL